MAGWVGEDCIWHVSIGILQMVLVKNQGSRPTLNCSVSLAIFSHWSNSDVPNIDHPNLYLRTVKKKIAMPSWLRPCNAPS
jgi:hypothetical protein